MNESERLDVESRLQNTMINIEFVQQLPNFKQVVPIQPILKWYMMLYPGYSNSSMYNYKALYAQINELEVEESRVNLFE